MKELSQLTAEELKQISTTAMEDFCNGYYWMFEKQFKSSCYSEKRMTTTALQNEVSGIIAIHRIAYGGAGTGSFWVVFDKPALFSLGGLTIMQPLPRIKEQCLRGNAEDAAALADAVGEIGNLLVGSFNKVLREGCEDVKGLGNEITLRLRLPVPVGKIGLEIDTDTENHTVFAHKFELPGLDPFFLRVIFPSFA
ncbi:MAG: hypothetical protein JXR40_12890 [Pontiellaceae bacterium]|nr:hypothetical protein [Pontiellaceae bacterium]